jgi:hypothetical protein
MGAMAMTERVRNRIERDFPQAGSADDVSRLVAGASDSERVQAAIVLAASGRLGDLRDAIALAQIDWRDLLVNVGLADDDWPVRLDSMLGRTTA